MTGTQALADRRVVVWGTGAEGVSMATTALAVGADVSFVRDDSVPARQWVGEDSLVVAGPGVLEGPEVEVLVLSPGVSRYRPEVAAARARGITVTSATALWLDDHAQDQVIAVTGTKGKSTTAWLTSLLLRAAGRRVVLGGNVGTPVTDLPPSADVDVYVLEVSSYQAAEVTTSPPVAVLTLLAPDHLDWHGGYERYVEDKLNLLAHRPDIMLAVNDRSPAALSATAGFGRRHRYRSEDGVLTIDDVASGALPGGLRGRHNLDNLAGAATAFMLCEGSRPDAAQLEAAVRDMPSLPGRLHTVASGDGLEFVDDSLASNPAGAGAAVATFVGRPLALVMGGHDRGVDTADLVDALLAGDPPAVVVGLDALGRRVLGQLEQAGHRGALSKAASIEEAVQSAVAALGGGGVVLFSPGAPTPADQGTYRDRGAAFSRAAARVLAGADVTVADR